MKYAAVPLLALAPIAGAQLSHEAAFDLRGGARQLFALSVSVVGDLDGDGSADVAVYSFDQTWNASVVRLHSGRDGAFLRELPPIAPVPTNYSGRGVVDGVGDLDDDGRDDLVVGDGTGSVARVYSGATGKVLFQLHGASGEGFGAAVGNAGDLNADGVSDVVVGALRPYGGGREYASVFSGADGSKLHTLLAHGRGRVRAEERFGSSVAGAGDVDRDGFDDVAVGAPLGGRYVRNPIFPQVWTSDFSGCVRVYSGKDGALLHTVYGDRDWLGLGYSVAGVGDVDGDGHDDLAAGTNNAEEPFLPGYARVISGRDGSTLHTLLEDEPVTQSFVSVAAAGDLDGGGRPDVLVGTQSGGYAFAGESGVELVHFSPGVFTLGPCTVGGGSDMNGDGTPDFVVAVPEPFYGGGFVRVFHSQPPRSARR